MASTKYTAAMLPCSTPAAAQDGIEAAIEQGTARWLKPGQTLTTSWAIEISA